MLLKWYTWLHLTWQTNSGPLTVSESSIISIIFSYIHTDICTYSFKYQHCCWAGWSQTERRSHQTVALTLKGKGLQGAPRVLILSVWLTGFQYRSETATRGRNTQKWQRDPKSIFQETEKKADSCIVILKEMLFWLTKHCAAYNQSIHILPWQK